MTPGMQILNGISTYLKLNRKIKNVNPNNFEGIIE